jgi:hypothetical protein
VGSRFEPEGALLPGWHRREGGWLRALGMPRHHCGRQRMQRESPPPPARIAGECITGLDNPRACPGGAGRREREPHELWLPRER